MKKILTISVLTAACLSGLAQDSTTEASLGKTIQDLTYNWDLEADELDSYASLQKFCASPEYREEIITLLKDIHHYDSVLYDRLSKASRFSKDREIEKTLEEIEKFEKEYDMRSFLHFLHEECVRSKDVERKADELKNDIGANSYDGQIYLIETELTKYIKHITKRVDHIRDRVNHLHIN